MEPPVAAPAKTRSKKPAADDASCCAPGVSPVDLAEQARPEDEELAELAKALAHPVRILIVRNLLRIGTCYFGKLADLLPVAASTASQHLSILKDAGVVIHDPKAERPCYCVDLTKLKRIRALVDQL